MEVWNLQRQTNIYGMEEQRSPTHVQHRELIQYHVIYHGASLVAQMVKNLPAIWETWVRSLGWEDSLEEGIATHSSILPWRIPWTEEPGGLRSLGLQSRTRLTG